MTFELGSIIAASIVVFLTFGGCIIWNIRLEGRVNYCEKTISRQDTTITELWTRITNFDSKVVEKLSKIEISLARLEGKMQIDNDRHDG